SDILLIDLIGITDVSTADESRYMLTALTVELIIIMDDMRTAKCKAVIGIKPFRNINYTAIGKTCEFFLKSVYKCFFGFECVISVR
ncbi:hypothetical protein PZH37_18330, partial [[Eubacterium] siraeum]|nr:hypothetical protein [[Eubacterium] siraeum]